MARIAMKILVISNILLIQTYGGVCCIGTIRHLKQVKSAEVLYRIKDIKQKIVQTSPEGIFHEALDKSGLAGTPPDHSLRPLLQEGAHGHDLDVIVRGSACGYSRMQV